MIFFVTLAVLVSYTSDAYGQTICAGMPDGVYGTGCKSFELCKDGRLHTIDCGTLVFNSDTQKCDEPQNVPPPCGQYRDCTHMPNGSFADFDYNCTSYYTCLYKQFYGHNFCTPGTVFEQSLGTCVWPADAYVPCGTKIRPDWPSETAAPTIH